MKFSKANEYEKIIKETIYSLVKTMPYVVSISNEMTKQETELKKNDKSLFVDFLPNDKVSITMFVVVKYTDEITIPEIVYQIQEKIQKSLSSIISFKIRNIDVVVTGVLL